ncbi:hypothetical protein PIB30_083130 [Stylosanthes scabra]|uniref:Uncharacterized protein n=1 Tax=Stylosanthes scabra TaxID=79078 RepID=A0ABU6XQP3_9FABA|nr:hypothetical protein [Stylosanthes scabra]
MGGQSPDTGRERLLTSSIIPDECDRVLEDRKPVEDTRPCLQDRIQWRTQDGMAVFKDNEVTVAIVGGRSDAGRRERRLGGVGRRGVLTGGEKLHNDDAGETELVEDFGCRNGGRSCSVRELGSTLLSFVTLPHGHEESDPKVAQLGGEAKTRLVVEAGPTVGAAP